jgi:ABC-type lipoprotein release transport system permease subunit
VFINLFNAFVLVVFLLGTTNVFADFEDNENFIPARARKIVVFRKEIGAQEKNDILVRHGARIRKHFLLVCGRKLKMCTKVLTLFLILEVSVDGFFHTRPAQSYDKIAVYLYLDAAAKLISDVEHLEVKLSSSWIEPHVALEQLSRWQEKFNLDFKERVQEVNHLHLLLNQYIYKTQKLIQEYKVKGKDVFLRQDYFDIQEEILQEFDTLRSLLDPLLLNKRSFPKIFPHNFQ